MRLAVAIVLVALFGAITANKALFKELSQINKHPFGATMLAAISTNLRAKTPITDVQDLLQQILAQLQGDSQTLDTNYHSTRDNLAAAIDNNNNLISTFQQTIDTLNSALANYNEEGTNRVNEVHELTERVANTQADLDQLNHDEVGQLADYDADIQNLNDAIAAANQALEKLKTYQSATGASLIQVASAAKNHLKKFSATMKHMAKKLAKHGTMYAPLIHELIELTQDVEEDKASQVVDLLNQLINLLQQALADLQNQRASTVAANAQRRQDDQTSIDNDNAQIDRDQQRIDELTSQAQQAQQELDTATQNLSDAQSALAAAQSSYDANEENYKHERPRYDELIAILEKLIQHFNDNVAAVDQWTANQINGEDNE
jgi:chromosome segregation ATPase